MARDGNGSRRVGDQQDCPRRVVTSLWATPTSASGATRPKPDPEYIALLVLERSFATCGNLTPTLNLIDDEELMDIERVCSSCFEDIDVRIWIRDQEGPRGCDACGKYDSPTVAFKDLCEYLEECLKGFWGFAADQLPYESAEGGYQGTTWLTSELVFDEVGLGLVRDKKDRLLHAFYGHLSSEVWCDYDWLRLDEDVALRTSWDRFCDDIKYRRRFFFQTRGGDDQDSDSFSHAKLLRTISQLASQLGLLKALPSGLSLYRARTKISTKDPLNAATFGPPPADKALQSNRMNPPGIPMFYGAERPSTAVREVRARSARVGVFKTNRPLRVLDLSSLTEVPHIWSNPDRSRRLGLKFLHRFTAAI